MIMRKLLSKGYYKIKHYNHEEIKIMYYNGERFEMFPNDPGINDEIETYQKIEVVSSPVEPEVSDANSVHIDNIYNLIDACFTETYDDIRRHAPDNQILIADYLRATKIKLINEISCLSR